MRAIDRFVRIAVWLSAILACGCMVAMMLLIALEVVLRPLGHSMLLTDEYSGYMVLAVLGFGAAYSFQSRAMLRVEFIFEKLGQSTRRALTIVYTLLTLGFCAILVYRLGLFAWTSYVRETFAPTPMRTPLFIPQAFVPIGFVLLCLVAVRRLFEPTPPEGETKHDIDELSV